jgi:hypothetical protein
VKPCQGSWALSGGSDPVGRRHNRRASDVRVSAKAKGRNRLVVDRRTIGLSAFVIRCVYLRTRRGMASSQYGHATAASRAPRCSQFKSVSCRLRSAPVSIRRSRPPFRQKFNLRLHGWWRHAVWSIGMQLQINDVAPGADGGVTAPTGEVGTAMDQTAFSKAAPFCVRRSPFRMKVYCLPGA